jgi:hypothetical protein
MRSVSRGVEEEYNRINKRTKEDPGTAGDQSEENWAAIPRNWLPPKYKIVTKGRIIGHSGDTSPQVDILTLDSSYPKALFDKKLYLAGGVAAAFECKLTLRTAHISESVQNAAQINNLYPKKEGTPRLELSTPIVYGVLAHSHSWKRDGSNPTNNVESKLLEESKNNTEHPRELIDLVCISDLADWNTVKWPFMPGFKKDKIGNKRIKIDTWLPPQTNFHKNSKDNENKPNPNGYTPIGSFITNLIRKLAWEDEDLRSLASYFHESAPPYFCRGLNR